MNLNKRDCPWVIVLIRGGAMTSLFSQMHFDFVHENAMVVLKDFFTLKPIFEKYYFGAHKCFTKYIHKILSLWMSAMNKLL